MPSTKLLKERIESIQDTMKITNAMYLISSSKLRKARKNYQAVSPYFERMQMTMTRVLPHLPEEPVHPFFHTRNPESPRRAYLVLTADKGMAGAYNQNLLKFLREHADQNDRFYVIGQVGYRALFRKDPRLVEDFHEGEENGFYYEVKEVISCIQKGQTESAVCPLEMTLENARLFDQVLRGEGRD